MTTLPRPSAQRRLPRPRTSTVELLALLVAAAALAGRAEHAATVLRCDVLARQSAATKQGDALDALPATADLATVERELVTTRAVLARFALNDVKGVLDRFVRTPEGPVVPPVHMLRQGGLDLLLYMQFCATFELAGAAQESCLSIAEYGRAVDCYDTVVIGRALPECFR